MSSSVKVSLDGVGETTKKINMYDMELKREVIKIVAKTATRTVKVAKGKAPVKTGKLRNSIKNKMVLDKSGLHRTVVPRGAPHRHLVEYGTVSRFTGGRSRDGKFAPNKKSRFANGAHRGKMPANPFMTESENEVIGKYRSDMGKVVNRDRTI